MRDATGGEPITQPVRPVIGATYISLSGWEQALDQSRDHLSVLTSSIQQLLHLFLEFRRPGPVASMGKRLSRVRKLNVDVGQEYPDRLKSQHISQLNIVFQRSNGSPGGGAIATHVTHVPN